MTHWVTPHVGSLLPLQLTLISLIVMIVFFRTKMNHDSVTSGGIYMGAMFFGILMIMYNGFSELALTVLRLPVFFKQRDLLLYPACAHTLPSWILKFPVTLMEVCGYVSLTYYVIGYDPNVGRFFKQFLIMLAVNQVAASLFRLIGGAARNMIVANVFSMLIMMTFMVVNGFILTIENVKKWWIWAYWISPFMYVQNVITGNEFLGHSWDKILNSTVSNETLGVQVLKSHGMFPEAKWYWIGFGALLGFTLLFNALYTLALTYLRPYGNPTSSISEEELKQMQFNVNNENLDANPLRSRRTVQPIGDKTETNLEMLEGDSGPAQKGMVLPFLPLSLTFDDIRYSVDMPQEMKAHGVVDDRLALLKGVSGSFRPGVLTALMGVSGAGKTTLMDVLSGRKTGGYIEGNVSISGYPKNQETFARVSGYCEQNDIHSPQLTVSESLLFSAWLRLLKDIDTNK